MINPLLRDLLQSLTLGFGLAVALTHSFYKPTAYAISIATPLLAAVCFVAMRPWRRDREVSR